MKETNKARKNKILKSRTEAGINLVDDPKKIINWILYCKLKRFH